MANSLLKAVQKINPSIRASNRTIIRRQGHPSVTNYNNLSKSKLRFFKIGHYRRDGFKHICDVVYDKTTGKWSYTNTKNKLMFSEHCSWIYFIVVGGIIFKVGESGNPMGILKKGTLNECRTGSTSRLGRLMTGDLTDEYIRKALKNETNIQIYAKQCNSVQTETIIGGRADTAIGKTHQDEEKKYLNYIAKNTGMLPKLNKSHK